MKLVHDLFKKIVSKRAGLPILEFKDCMNQKSSIYFSSEIHWMNDSAYRVLKRVVQWSKANDVNASLLFGSSVYLRLKYKTKHPLLNIQNGEVFFDGVKIERSLDFSEIVHSTQ